MENLEIEKEDNKGPCWLGGGVNNHGSVENSRQSPLTPRVTVIRQSNTKTNCIITTLLMFFVVLSFCFQSLAGREASRQYLYLKFYLTWAIQHNIATIEGKCDAYVASANL